jgi:N6-L-threonylcarbamoyladenine synthase
MDNAPKASAKNARNQTAGKRRMIILGLETSCDETAAAVVDQERRILANVIFSQVEAHRAYGGIVPEIAARAHLDRLDSLIREALKRSKLGFSDLDAIAATGGPGLIGGVIVGVTTAKAIAAVTGKPFLAVNHLEGHALSARLVHDLAFPYLLLLLSGGHSQILMVEGVGRYRRLGTTIDDAVGEAFDKTAKMLGLGYPGGAAVEQAAKTGDPLRFSLPRPMRGRPGCDFSFSGLKTAVRRTIEGLGEGLDGAPSSRDVADICAAFQEAVGDVLVDRCENALTACAALPSAPEALVVAGGVAANRRLRERLDELAGKIGLRLLAPPAGLCTDNGAMIAWAGIERLRLGLTDKLNFAPRPRWPLDANAAPATGAGVKA